MAANCAAGIVWRPCAVLVLLLLVGLCGCEPALASPGAGADGWLGMDGGAPIREPCLPAGRASFGFRRRLVGEKLAVRAALVGLSDASGQEVDGRWRQVLRQVEQPLATCAPLPAGAPPARWQVSLELLIGGGGQVLGTVLEDPAATLDRRCVEGAARALRLPPAGTGRPRRIRLALRLNRALEKIYVRDDFPICPPPPPPGQGGGGTGEGTIRLGR